MSAFVTTSGAKTTPCSPRKLGAVANKRVLNSAVGVRAGSEVCKRGSHRPLVVREGFGAEAPAWTISGSRREPPPPPESPGPDHYEVPLDPCNYKIVATVQDVRQRDYRTDTSDIDYIVHRKFPDIRPLTIPGADWGTSYIMPSCTPSPSEYRPGEFQANYDFYGSKTTAKRRAKSRSVTKKAKEKESHEPQMFNPNELERVTTPVYSLPRAPVKRFMDKLKDDNPGPGAYDVGAQVKRAPKWTERLRVRPEKRTVQKVQLKGWETSRFEV